MKTNKNEPMAKYSNQVQTTKNYGMFSKLDGNREPNLLHLKRLTSSMSERYLFTVIIVNEKMQVIDGQHRLSACIELGLPVYYIVVNGYGLKEVQILNANSKTWNHADYLQGYCDLGYTEYIKFREFKDTYQLQHSDCLLLLCGSDNGDICKDFYNGTLKIKNLNDAEDMAIKLQMIGNYFDGYKASSFVRVMRQMMLRDNFVFSEFISKLQLQPTALKACVRASEYKLLIEDIYNYKRREKVNLRF